MRVPAMLGALRERRFRLLWLGQSTSVLGDALVPVALAFAVLGLPGGSASDLGFVFAAPCTRRSPSSCSPAPPSSGTWSA